MISTGSLPLWNLYGCETDMMIGYHAVPVIVDAYLKGIGDFDAEKALRACVSSADRDDYRGIGLYKKYGYIPYDMEKESLSKTLEYAYDDYCIARMAKKKKRKLRKGFTSVRNHFAIYIIPRLLLCSREIVKVNLSPALRQKTIPNILHREQCMAVFLVCSAGSDGLIGLLGSKDRFAEKARQYVCLCS